MSWGSRPKKFVPGEAFASLTDLVDHLDIGGWVWVHHKPWHPKVFANTQLHIVRSWCASGFARKAEVNPEWVKHQERLEATKRLAAGTTEFEEIAS